MCGHEIRWSNNVYVCYVQGVTLPHCSYLDIYISQTAVDLTIPAKKSKENEYNRYEFSDQKVHNYGLYLGWFEIGLRNHIRTE